MKQIKLLNVSGKGQLVFRQEFSVDIPDVPLICIYGANGSGKTAFADNVDICLFGETANRWTENKKSTIYRTIQ
jgi:DNA repair exonuclease SbcCD ATPase subunit